jgi:2-amino-4-hydroxy-6-hydroxymethyldihydropteridine diphosphokinase
MIRCYLSLGSNLANPELQLQRAVELLRCSAMVNVLKVANNYYSKPYGHIQHQPDFVNTVLMLDTWHSPYGLLLLCNSIEIYMGRERLQRWGPRVIDIDIVFYGQQKINTSKLTIPHPDMENRDFVIEPLAELQQVV